MSGIILAGLVAAWIIVAALVAAMSVYRIQSPVFSVITGMAVFAVLLPLPMFDEIAAQGPFAKLCKANAEVFPETMNLRGKTVWFASFTEVRVPVGPLEATAYQRNFAEVTTQKPVYHFVEHVADGGWLARAFTRSKDPLLFDGRCGPPAVARWEAAQGIRQVARPGVDDAAR